VLKHLQHSSADNSSRHLQHVTYVTWQYRRYGVTDDLGRAGQMFQSRVHVGLERHERAAAAAPEQLLLHQQTRFVGEGQHAQGRTEYHGGEGRAGAICQQMQVDGDAVVALRVELEEYTLDGVDGVLLKVARDDGDDFWRKKLAWECGMVGAGGGGRLMRRVLPDGRMEEQS
jgi:hypothetical protein